MMTGYFLLDNQNRFAPIRGDGRRFHGHASRNQKIRLIGVHTGETDPTSSSAVNIARYLSTTDRAASYHEVYDSTRAISLLPDSYTAFGIRGLNSPTWHCSFATRAHLWGKTGGWDEAALRISAGRVARVVQAYSIPMRWLTKTEADQGRPGFIRHSTADPSRRSDPGANFPAARWFELITAAAQGQPLQEDDMAQHEERLEAIEKSVAGIVEILRGDPAKGGVAEHLKGNMFERLFRVEQDVQKVLNRLGQLELAAGEPSAIAKELGRRLSG